MITSAPITTSSSSTACSTVTSGSRPPATLTVNVEPDRSNGATAGRTCTRIGWASPSLKRMSPTPAGRPTSVLVSPGEVVDDGLHHAPAAVLGRAWHGGRHSGAHHGRVDRFGLADKAVDGGGRLDFGEGLDGLDALGDDLRLRWFGDGAAERGGRGGRVL